MRAINNQNFSRLPLFFLVYKVNSTNMKAHNILAIFIIAAILITSCNKDEEGTNRQMTKSYTYSQNLRGSAGVKGELPLPDLRLSDVIGSDTANNLQRAELQLAQTYFEITGLNQVESPDTVAVVLEDFTVKVGSRPGVNLGDCSTDATGTNEFPSDVQLSTNKYISLIQTVFSDATSGSKRANITVSFTPNVDITSSDNVQINIHFGGIYHYVVR